MTASDGALLIFLAIFVAGVVWAWKRGKHGYRTVQALMAQVEASASADARSAALASNAVSLHLSGVGSNHAVYDDDNDGSRDDHYLGGIDYDHLAALVARQLRGGGLDRLDADRTGLRSGPRGLVARDALRHQGDQVIYGPGEEPF